MFFDCQIPDHRLSMLVSAIVDRREFLETSTLLTGGALLSGVPVSGVDGPSPQTPRADSRMIGIQAGAVSFVDEGTERVLDTF